jgi:hypothetical protein
LVLLLHAASAKGAKRAAEAYAEKEGRRSMRETSSRFAWRTPMSARRERVREGSASHVPRAASSFLAGCQRAVGPEVPTFARELGSPEPRSAHDAVAFAGA